jgi:ABC-2 type transport system ATP-binding protein
MLSLQSVSKHYGEKRALDKVSFEVNAGEVIALLGANGSGKTTTIQSICGLLLFEEGDITFDRRSITSDKAYLGKIGAVLDGSRNVNWRLTVSQNADYFARLKGPLVKNHKTHIAQLEERLGLAEYRGQTVMKLSTGNRQKTALLCALVHSPNLLLLDEPTLGLDMDTVTELQDIIVNQAQQFQQGFLITSHDMSFIDSICNKVVVLDKGKVIFSGSAQQLKEKLFGYELLLQAREEQLKDMKQFIVEQVSESNQVSVSGNVLSLQYNNVSLAVPVVAWLQTQAWQPEKLTINELNIEKAYRSLVKKEDVA